MIPFLIAFFSIIILMSFHELGHFLLAKKFGVKIEEFGIGYPPRIIGKKFGETIYSLNLLPFGAFVRLPGENKRIDDPRSFSQQSVGKRILIALGGVFSFWIIAIIIFSITFSLGSVAVIEDESVSNLIDPKVQVAGVAPGSPAENMDLKTGDTIKKLSIGDEEVFPLKVKEVQGFVSRYKGEEINLVLERGEEVFEISLTPRVSPPEGEGPIGIALVRTAIQKYPWYLALGQGFLTTGRLTWVIVQGYTLAVRNIFQGLPSGVQLVGPVGVFQMLTQTQQLGVSYFLNFLALICLYLAVFNLLPIPAVDGGKVLFLLIEGVRKKPISEKIEQRITTFSFAILLILMAWVTVRDIVRLI